MRAGSSWSVCLSLWLVMAAVGCRPQPGYPSRPITLVCPWAAGGGTDRVARRLAMLLEQELKTPVNVINATGGKGVTGHNRGINARPDGYTLAMITFELNTMHWMGLTELSYHDCIPLISVNEDYAALLVRSDARWQSLAQLQSDIRREPKKLTASGTAIGGAWHLALAGWLNAIDLEADDVIWVPSEGANPSLQQLISGGVDMVCCSLPEARSLLEEHQVRALGVMSPERASGFEQVETFPEQGNNWTLGGWRGLAVPKKTPQPIVDKLVQALEKIVSREPQEESFAGFMQSQKFDSTWRRPEEFLAFLKATDDKLGTLLASEAMRSVSHDRFNPMTYPNALAGLLAAALVGLAFFPVTPEEPDLTPLQSPQANSAKPAIDNFIFVILTGVAYILFAESIGFLLLCSATLAALLLKFGTRPVASLAISLTVVPAVYFLFAYVLRVPLPPGWLG